MNVEVEERVEGRGEAPQEAIPALHPARYAGRLGAGPQYGRSLDGFDDVGEFRWWRQLPDDALEECPCGFAPELAAHYRVASAYRSLPDAIKAAFEKNVEVLAGKAYLTRLPSSVPDGKALVHNFVKPARRGGTAASDTGCNRLTTRWSSVHAGGRLSLGRTIK